MASPGELFKQLSLPNKIYSTLLVLIIIMASGFPMFINSKGVYIACFLYTLAGAITLQIKTSWIIRYVAVFSYLMLIQTAYYGEFYVSTAFLQILLFLTAAMAVAILETVFIFLFIRVMLVLAAIALLLFVPILIHKGFFDTLIAFPFTFKITHEVYGIETSSYNLFFINFPPDFFDGLERNSGPFWEPAVFGGFSIIALIFNSLLSNTLFKRTNYIFFAAIITTFSTTTYIACFVFVIGFTFFKIKDQALKWCLLIVCLLTGIILFQKVEFLGKKIEEEYSEAAYTAFIKGGDSRMASAYLDLKELAEGSFYILFGRGSHPDTRVAGRDKEVSRTNGLTDLVSRYGILFAVFSIVSIWYSFRLVCRLGAVPYAQAWVALITVIVLAFSEVYFVFIFFKVLTLLRFSLANRSDSSATIPEQPSFARKVFQGFNHANFIK